MAKLWGPLHSDDARGKLADAVVYIGWRGIKDSRMYKVPKNPKTAGQVAWRANFTTSVGKYHLLSGADIVAWKERAAGFPYLGLNLFVEKWLKWKASLKSPVLLKNLQTTPGATYVVGSVLSSRAATMTFKVGITKGVWTHTKDVVATASGKGTVTGLTTGTNYYFTIDMVSATYPGTYGYKKITTT